MQKGLSILFLLKFLWLLVKVYYSKTIYFVCERLSEKYNLHAITGGKHFLCNIAGSSSRFSLRHRYMALAVYENKSVSDDTLRLSGFQSVYDKNIQIHYSSLINIRSYLLLTIKYFS